MDSERYSLDENMIRSILLKAKPFGHNQKPENLNLGFGFLYYAIVRAIRPKHVLVIGSGFGFSVVCLALGLKDNGEGRLTFVDPGYDVLKNGPLKTIGGRGKWKKAEEVWHHFEFFGLAKPYSFRKSNLLRKPNRTGGYSHDESRFKGRSSRALAFFQKAIGVDPAEDRLCRKLHPA